MGLKPYVVRDGDFIAKLALRYGFDANKAWNHPKNADLKSKRQDPDLLCRGDLLWIEEKPRKWLDIHVGRANKFTAEVPLVNVRVRICNHIGQALGGAEYKTHEGVIPSAGSLDGDGWLNVKVPVHFEKITVHIPSKDLNIHLFVGHLDPATEFSGAVQRLHQLAYYRGSMPIIDPAHPGLVRAVRAFQEKEELDVTGKFDAATTDKLKQRFGR